MLVPLFLSNLWSQDKVSMPFSAPPLNQRLSSKLSTPRPSPLADSLLLKSFHASAANASSVIHVATALAYSDLLDSMIEPAWKLNENILNAAAASPTVTRVVITSSVVSAMRIPADVATDKTITE